MEKNLNCEMRVMYALFTLLFLFGLFSKLFAIIGLVLVAFGAFTGTCIGAKLIGPAFCKKSVIDALSKAKDELKDAADDVVDNVKDTADKVKDNIKKD